MRKLTKFVAVSACFLVSQVFAQKVTVNVSQAAKEKSPHSVGTVTLQDTPHGLLIHPNLQGLAPGIHGMHIHEEGSCENYGMAALGHLDPKKTNRHRGPYDNSGHLGDLPVLIVGKDKKAALPTFAPGLTVNDVLGHALVIHANGDNYFDKPELNGGGGDRVACGVLPKTASGKAVPKKSTEPAMKPSVPAKPAAAKSAVVPSAPEPASVKPAPAASPAPAAAPMPSAPGSNSSSNQANTRTVVSAPSSRSSGSRGSKDNESLMHDVVLHLPKMAS